jgi:hypothetical protein
MAGERTLYRRANRFNPLMAACKSFASVGKVTTVREPVRTE